MVVIPWYVNLIVTSILASDWLSWKLKVKSFVPHCFVMCLSPQCSLFANQLYFLTSTSINTHISPPPLLTNYPPKNKQSSPYYKKHKKKHNSLLINFVFLIFKLTLILHSDPLKTVTVCSLIIPEDFVKCCLCIFHKQVARGN